MKKNNLNKIWNLVCNKIRGINQERFYNARAKKTLSLRQNKISDFKRWENSEELYSDWDERTRILAGFIKPGSSIIEFGAGKMAIKKFLPPNCKYTASDLHKRSKDVIICDLNNKIKIDLSNYNTAVFSGVLEYVYDIENVISQLETSVQNIALSYACSDITDVNRLRRGWLSDYTKKELEEVFKKHNFLVVDYKEWRMQSLFKLKKIKN